MALHGDISINGVPLIRWRARRLDPLVTADAEHRYDVRVAWTEHALGGPREASAEVVHRYSDGAAELAIKAITAAAEASG